MRNNERNSALDPDRNERGNAAVTIVLNPEQSDSEQREMNEREDINKDVADIGDIDNGMDADADTDKAVALDQNKNTANDSNELHITDVSLTDILDSSVEDRTPGVEIKNPEFPVVGSSLGHVTESQNSIDLHSFNVLPSNASTPLGKAAKKGSQNDKQLRFTFKSHQNIDKSCEKTESKDIQVTNGKTQIQKTIENRLTQLNKKDSALPSTEACLEDDFDEESNTVVAGKLVYVKQKMSKMVRECSASSAKVKKAMKGMEKASKRELGMPAEKTDEIEKKISEKAKTNFKDNIDKTRKSGKGQHSKTDNRPGNEASRDSDLKIEDKVTDGKSSNSKHHKKRKKQQVVSDSESDDETICAKKRQKIRQQRDKNGGSGEILSKVGKLDVSPGVSKKTLSKLQQFKFDESKQSVSSSSFLCNTSLSDSMLSGAMWTADKPDKSSASDAGTENISRGVIQTGTEDHNKSVGIRDDKNESAKPVRSKEKVVLTRDEDESVTNAVARGSDKDLKLLGYNNGNESAKPICSKENDEGVKVVGTKDVDRSVNLIGSKDRAKSVNVFDNGPLVSERAEVRAVSTVSENNVKMHEPGRELKLVKKNEIVVDIEGSKSHSESTILGNRNTSPAWLLKLNRKLTSPNVLSQSAGNSTSEQKYKPKQASPASNAVPVGNRHSSSVSSSVISETLPAKQKTNSTLSGRENLLGNESENRSLIFSVADDLDKELDDIDFSAKF